MKTVSKICVILSGRDLPRQSAHEDCLKVFIETIKMKYSIDLEAQDIAVVHRRSDGNLIAKFIHFGPGSSYKRLIKRHDRWNPQPNVQVYANVLLTKANRKIRFYVSRCKTAGTIDAYQTERSGRISIKAMALDMEYKLINSFADMRTFITSAVMDLVNQANEERRQRRAHQHMELNHHRSLMDMSGQS